MAKRKAADMAPDADPSISSSDWQLIKSANALDVETFERRFVDPQLMRVADHEITLRSPADIREHAELSSAFQLIASSSADHYKHSSIGWHPIRKRREMRQEEMKYLFVTIAPEFPTVLGFLSFMLTHDSTPCVPVLYIYEIHVDINHRELGMGGRFMAIAEDIARKAGVEKVMLTCFLYNVRARKFYAKMGYVVDESSPRDRVTRKKTVRVDHVILSKCLRSDAIAGSGHDAVTNTAVCAPSNVPSPALAAEPLPGIAEPHVELCDSLPHLKVWISRLKALQASAKSQNEPSSLSMWTEFDPWEDSGEAEALLAGQTRFFADLAVKAESLRELASSQHLLLDQQHRGLAQRNRMRAKQIRAWQEDEESRAIVAQFSRKSH